MPELAADLKRTYAPRLAEFVSDERYGDWRFKLYGLADPAKGVRPELLAIVEFERRARIEDVIGNPDGPDLDRYTARRFGGLV